MSRLPPALGISPEGGNPSVAKPRYAFESDSKRLQDTVRFIYRDAVDACGQRGDLQAGMVAAWHPLYPILAVATSLSVSEYDALSGCRRNQVDSTGSPIKLRYSTDGRFLVLLTKERNIVAWSTSTWRRLELLRAEKRYAKRPLVSGLLAIGCSGASGEAPIVFYSPIGKQTLRTVHMAVVLGGQLQAQSKAEKTLTPGFKLRSENKGQIVGLAAHPIDPKLLFTLLINGTLVMQAVGNGTMTAVHDVIVPFDAKRERVHLHTSLHPILKGASLVFVEAERSGLTVITAFQNAMKILVCLPPHSGAVLAGSGLIHRSCLLIAAFRHAGGNVGLKAWRLLPDSRSVTLITVGTSPSTVWDAMQSGVTMGSDGSAVADVTGDAMLSGMLLHGPSGLMAFLTSRYDDIGVAHFRLPLLSAVDGGHPLEGLGASFCLPMHTAPGFWTTGARQMDGVVPKLTFPRYAYVMNLGRMCAYDVANGLLTEMMQPPPPTSSGQERQLMRCIHSSQQGIWILFARILSDVDGSDLSADSYEYRAVSDSDVSMSTGTVGWFAGQDAAFVGKEDEMTILLSNSGDLVALYETSKLLHPNPRPQAVLEVSGASRSSWGSICRLFSGPPRHIPRPPKPRPAMSQEASEPLDQEVDFDTDDENEQLLREWEESEANRLQPPKQVVVLTMENMLLLVDASTSGFSQLSKPQSSHGSRGYLNRVPQLQLRPSEAVIQFSWQTLLDPGDDVHSDMEGVADTLPCAAAILTSDRVLIVDPCLNVLVAISIPGDAGIPTSCLWVGPALLVSTSVNQVFMAGWDGTPIHLASMLSGPAIVLVAALADRLVLAMRGEGPGLLAGRTETCCRGFPVLPALLMGWAGIARRGILPGGPPRARREMRSLLASYDSSQLSLSTLNALVESGFPKVAAAAAAASESMEVTAEYRASLAAAAGNWQPIIDILEQELEACPSFPPEPDTDLYNKLVALGRSLESHGRFSLARQIFYKAGAWSELLSLCVFEGDFSALHECAREGGGAIIEALSHQLIAVNEDAFRRASTISKEYGGCNTGDDWRVEPKTEVMHVKDVDGGEEACDQSPKSLVDTMEDASKEEIAGQLLIDVSPNEWEVAPLGRLPYMEASLAVSISAAASGNLLSTNSKRSRTSRKEGIQEQNAAGPNESKSSGNGDEDGGQPIAKLDLSNLESYLGVVGASVVSESERKGASAASMMRGNISSVLIGRTPAEDAREASSGHAILYAGDMTPRSSDMLDLQSIPESEGESGGKVSSSPKGADVSKSAVMQDRKGSMKGAAARHGTKESLRQSVDDEFDDFFSSEEEDETFANADDRSTGSFAAATSSRFLFNIRSPEEATSLKASADPSALRNAVQNLKLGGASGPALLSGASADERLQHELATQRSRDTMASGDASVISMEESSVGDQQDNPISSSPTKAEKRESAPIDPFFAFDSLGIIDGSEDTEQQVPFDSGDEDVKEDGKRHKIPSDPFATLPGLPPSLADHQSGLHHSIAATVGKDHVASSEKRPPLPENEFRTVEAKEVTGKAPALSLAQMRGELAEPVPKQDLLSGWDDFEALFHPDSQRKDSAAPQLQLSSARSQAPLPVKDDAGFSLESGARQERDKALEMSSKPSNAPDRNPSPYLQAEHSAAEETFCKGGWAEAADRFAACLSVADNEHAHEIRRLCKNQYAAALLLQKASPAPPMVASKLSRYAVALKTGERAHAAAAAFAVEANMAAGNYGWSADQLSWLVVAAAEQTIDIPGMDMNVLQERLMICDRSGGRDTNIETGVEDVEAFADIIESCTGKEDIDDLVGNLSIP